LESLLLSKLDQIKSDGELFHAFDKSPIFKAILDQEAIKFDDNPLRQRDISPVREITELLDLGYDVNEKISGYSPIMLCAILGQNENFKKLFERGAEVKDLISHSPYRHVKSSLLSYKISPEMAKLIYEVSDSKVLHSRDLQLAKNTILWQQVQFYNDCDKQIASSDGDGAGNIYLKTLKDELLNGFLFMKFSSNVLYSKGSFSDKIKCLDENSRLEEVAKNAIDKKFSIIIPFHILRMQSKLHDYEFINIASPKQLNEMAEKISQGIYNKRKEEETVDDSLFTSIKSCIREITNHDKLLESRKNQILSTVDPRSCEILLARFDAVNSYCLFIHSKGEGDIDRAFKDLIVDKNSPKAVLEQFDRFKITAVRLAIANPNHFGNIGMV
jgi:hypothetical protein